jgi:hypothetical protein
MTGQVRRIDRRWLLLLAALGLMAGACASPVRAVRVDRTVAHRDLMRSAVTTGELSWSTRDVLLERGLLDDFQGQPATAIAGLHRAMVRDDGSPDLLFSLAEMSYLHGKRTEQHRHLLAAAIYAYAYLFPEDGGRRPDAFDPRLRIAATLYNWALTAALASPDGSEVIPRAGNFELPFGSIAVGFDAAELAVGNRELFRFIPVAELKVEGLAMRYRWPGIGAPLAASTRHAANSPSGHDIMAPKVQVPVTALLRIDHARRALVNRQPLTSNLELHLAWDAESVEIAGESVPLESEPTAALALSFTGIPVVELELFGFMGRLSGLMAARPPLVSTTPYRPGLIPVVFVHGTASSIVRWAELYNRIQADPELRRRYQFWFFQYSSDNPIALSALRLRQALTGAVAALDPEGQDPALRQMVLVGHSQGGLLVKMQAIDTGDRLWNAVSRKPLADLRLRDETRALLEQALFIEPLPEVSRVIFISTPHRGSFLAASELVTNLIRRITTLPSQITGVYADVTRNLGAARSPFLPTAVDNMSPRHPFILGLQEIPVDPSVPAHSIISVKGTGPAEEGNDGVVAYRSAYIDEAVSTQVVRWPHSCQGHPQTMEEVRRILRLHADLTPGAELAGEPGAE